jgi:hypothetical protein
MHFSSLFNTTLVKTSHSMGPPNARAEAAAIFVMLIRSDGTKIRKTKWKKIQHDGVRV